MQKNDPIGFFDSGVGGISVLRTACQMLANERFLYYGDTKNAPYGTKTEAEIQSCARRAAQFLLSQNIKALVIACNTATCAAAALLRETYPNLIIIGMEPALKLAHDQCPQGKIIVLATPLALSSEKYKLLYSAYGEHAVSLPCPGLMELVERGDPQQSAIADYLREKLAPYLREGQAPVAVVLGCTHYVFLRPVLQRLLPSNTRILDGNEGTVRQLRRRLAEQALLAEEPCASPRVQFYSSAGSASIPLMEKLFSIEC